MVAQDIQRIARENVRMDFNQTTKLESLAKILEETRQSVQSLSLVSANRNDLEDLCAQLASASTYRGQLVKEQRILASLPYKHMFARRTRVKSAYRKTFDWIFQPPCEAEFTNWLENEGHIYWISGKPGSGKSTLMKYLFEHPTTEKLLHKWAGGKRLVKASFFFWSVGTPMQKSQEGLLRSLLLEILKQSPDVIPVACPRLWDEECQDWGEGEIWTIEELAATLNRIAECSLDSSRFCFFLDGLDEYDGHHPDLIRIVDKISQSKSVKVCASSRPWNVFRDAYGDSGRVLYLENLTRGDIEHYVRSRLEEHTDLILLSLEDNGFEDLVQDIVHRAQGVFLWVYLVLDSLCDGLTNGDDVELLRARVRRIPSDLEDFFRLIINGIEEIYREKMAKTFQVVLQASETLTLMGLSFLDNRGDYVLDEPVQRMDKYEIMSRNAKTKRRVEGRYKGLLEVTTSPSATDFFNFKVDFFHRTVHDFIRMADVQRLLAQYLPPGFDPNIALCRIYLAMIKKMHVKKSDLSTAGPFQDLIIEFMENARKAELKTGMLQEELIDELERTVIEHASLLGAHHIRWGQSDALGNKGCSSLTELAMKKSLNNYVKERWTYELHSSECHTALNSVLNALSSESTTSDVAKPMPDMVEFLLRKGASPNRDIKSTTIFDLFLSRVLNRVRASSSSASGGPHEQEVMLIREQVIEMLLQYRANPNIPAWGELVLSLGIPSRKSQSSSQLRILKLLLRYGAQPGARFRTSTVWEVFLQSAYTYNEPSNQKTLAEATKCLLSHGADLEILIDVPGRRYVPVDNLIQHIFSLSYRRELLGIINNKRQGKKYLRTCYSLFIRNLWSMRLIMDPLWQVCVSAIAWARSKRMGNSLSEDANARPQRLWNSRTTKPDVRLGGSVLHCSVVVEGEVLEVPIPQGGARVPYYKYGPRESVSNVLINIVRLLGPRGEDEPTTQLSFGSHNVDRIFAKATRWNRRLAIKHTICTYSEMATILSVEAQHCHSRWFKRKLETDPVGFLEIVAKPKSTREEEQESEGGRTTSQVVSALRSPESARTGEHLFIFEQSLAVAETIWLWIELPTEDDADIFDSYAKRVERSLTVITGR